MIDRVDHAFPRAEIVSEVDADAVFAPETVAFFEEQRRLRHAEPVDRLLDVAHKEQPSRPRNAVQDRFLQAVAVLVFVDDDRLKLVAVLRGDLVIFQNLDRHMFKVVEIDRVLLTLRLAVQVEIPVQQTEERFQNRRRRAVLRKELIKRLAAKLRLLTAQFEQRGFCVAQRLFVLLGIPLRKTERRAAFRSGGKCSRIRFARIRKQRAVHPGKDEIDCRKHLFAIARQPVRLVSDRLDLRADLILSSSERILRLHPHGVWIVNRALLRRKPFVRRGQRGQEKRDAAERFVQGFLAFHRKDQTAVFLPLLRGKGVHCGVARLGLHDLRFKPVERTHGGRKPHAEEMPEDDLCAERVDRRDVRVRNGGRLSAEVCRRVAGLSLRGLSELFCDTGFHLARGGAREGQDQHVFDRNSLRNEPRDAHRKHGRLARACRRGDDHVSVFSDRIPLLRCELLFRHAPHLLRSKDRPGCTS